MARINLPLDLYVEFDGTKLQFYGDFGQDPIHPLSTQTIEAAIRTHLDGYRLPDKKRTYSFSARDRSDLTALAKSLDASAALIRKALKDGR